MRYIHDTIEFHIEEPCIVSLGKFDGLHMGHKLLIDELTAGRAKGLTSVVLTFDIPPKNFGGELPQVLTTQEEKCAVFAEAGVDVLIELPFTERLKHLMPEEFLRFLTERMPVVTMVCGTDFHFGYHRSGDCQVLRALGIQLGFETRIVDKLQDHGEDISSSRIRDCICRGDLEQAKRLLGYDYFLMAPVIHGQKLGRTIGFPTANQAPTHQKLMPPFGVYRSAACIGGKWFDGVTNIGKKPTIGDYPVGWETYLLDFSGDIYDRPMRTHLLSFIRGEQKFDSVEALKAQMNRDIFFAREK